MSLLPAIEGLEEFVGVADELMAAAMIIVRDAQMHPAGAFMAKSDLSLLTPTDKKVERLLRERIRVLGYPFYGEELGSAVGANRRYKVIVNPIDGTRPFANCDMGGSTIILYVYDMFASRIAVTIIGRPGTGEVWVAAGGTTKRYHYSYVTGEFTLLHTCRVWQYDQGVPRPTVYVDNPNPFTRRGVDMLTFDGLDRLDAALRYQEVTKFAVGSNGLHHCLVATGGPVVGSITTSIGGVRDLGGILVVENAGGITAAFRLSDQRELIQVDPHAGILDGYDFLVTAITESWLWTLVGILERAL